jgi:riboflavin synthase
MFSGIVEEIGTIKQITVEAVCTRFTVTATQILQDIHIGDSIAVNGVCLTVIAFDNTTFDIQAIPETLNVTNLGQLQVGSAVNLERSILPTTRIGGHMVQGHVDAVCQLLALEQGKEGTVARFSLPEALLPFIVKKGYVALDGMSLTVVSCSQTEFTVAFIPHTVAVTIVQYYQPGQGINLEVDMAGKYIHQFLSQYYASH